MLNPAILLGHEAPIRQRFLEAASLSLTAYSDAKTHGDLPITWLKDTVAEGFYLVIGKALIVCFRGTEAGKERFDVMADMDIRFGQAPVVGKAHRGFMGYTDRNWEEIRGLLNTFNPLNVVFCSHSLGAAMSVLTASKIAALTTSPRVSLFLFGCPKVMDKAGYDWFWQTFGGSTYSLRNCADSVCLGPTRKFIGPMYNWFMAHDSTLTQNLPTRKQMFWERIADIATNFARGEKYQVQSVADHSMSSYISQLQKGV